MNKQNSQIVEKFYVILLKNTLIKYGLITIFISFVLTIVFLSGINFNQFLFLHDEYLSTSLRESIISFSTNNPLSLGIPSATFIIVTFYDRLFYLLFYLFDRHILFAQAILYFLKLNILIYFPFLGFLKLSKLLNKKAENLSLYFIALFYSFNTFTLIYWHGNAFSLTILLCYALAPLAFYYFHEAIFNSNKDIYKYITAILFFLMSFGLYLYAAFIIFLLLYTLLYPVFFKINYLRVLKNLLLLTIIYVPFLSLLILVPYEVSFSTIKTLNLVGGETFTSMDGGFLYQFLMWFSWGIYNYWQPRNIFTFDSYFKTVPAIIAPFVVYALLVPLLVNKIKKSFNIIFFLLYLIFLFFIKGAQAPLGNIYIYLISHFSLLRVFRSPDTKFGFILIFILCLLLLQASASYKKKVFILLLSLVILIQGYLIFNGTAIKGENTKTSSDRIVAIPPEYQELADFIEKNPLPYGHILPLPSVEFGHYSLNKKMYIGQDILSKITSLPFLYTSNDTGMSSNSYDELINSLNNPQLKGLSKFPIRYVLLRKDSISDSKQKKVYKTVNNNLKKVFSNKIFNLYALPQPTPIIESTNISFSIESPIKSTVTFHKLKGNQKLFLNQSYSSNWAIYASNLSSISECNNKFIFPSNGIIECSSSDKIHGLLDIPSLFQKKLFNNTHSLAKGYSNVWVISQSEIKRNMDKKSYRTNADGSIDVSITIYYKTQAYFYMGLIFLSLIIFLYLIVIFILFRRKHYGKI